MSHRQERIAQAANVLRDARRERRTVGRISESHDIASVDDAYAIAALNVAADRAAGRVPVGKKIGLTSLAVQRQLGVDQPDYGILFADMEFADGDALPTDQLIQPKAEGEIAFVIGRDLSDETLSWGRFLNGIEYVLPALEIIDSAIDGWKITLVDTVADNASCGVYVLGTEPKRLGDVSLAACGMTLVKNDVSAAVGSGTACLGNPLHAAYWLAKTMQRLGDPLRAGDVVMSGALGPMVEFARGDRLSVDIGGLGRVRCFA